MSREFVRALKLKLTANEDRHIAGRPLPNAQAYDCYLRAHTAMYHWSEEGFEEALRLLHAGLNLVGENALLYAGIGYVHMASADLYMKSMDAIAKAEDYARKALDLDPGVSQVQMVLGYAQFMRGHPRECIRRCRQALSINPHDFDASLWLTFSLCCVGKTSEAFPIADRMIEMDPLNPSGYWMLSICHFFEGRFAEAYKAVRREPVGACLDVPVYRFWAAYMLAYSGRVEDALELLASVEESETSDAMLRVHSYSAVRTARQFQLPE